MDQTEIQAFVDRYLKQTQESREEMMHELARLTGIDEASLRAHLAGEEDGEYLVERIRRVL